MKRAVFFFAKLLIFLQISWSALAYSPEQYALQVLQKDLPLSLRWFGKAVQSEPLNQVEVYELYQSALSEAQLNKQLGISTKASVERMLILLDGARYFAPVQKAPLDFQNKKELVNKTLQVARDEMDRFQHGEDPQTLIEDWRAQGSQLYGRDFTKFLSDLVETFTEVQKFLGHSASDDFNDDLAEDQPDVERVTTGPMDTVNTEVAEEVSAETEESFESQRLKSYIDSAEAGKVADECQNAVVWKTDQAESCQSDDSLECDRSYARQCKKLQ